MRRFAPSQKFRMVTSSVAPLPPEARYRHHRKTHNVLHSHHRIKDLQHDNNMRVPTRASVAASRRRNGCLRMLARTWECDRRGVERYEDTDDVAPPQDPQTHALATISNPPPQPRQGKENTQVQPTTTPPPRAPTPHDLNPNSNTRPETASTDQATICRIRRCRLAALPPPHVHQPPS